MGPTWAPCGPHVGPINLAIRVHISWPWCIVQLITKHHTASYAVPQLYKFLIHHFNIAACQGTVSLRLINCCCILICIPVILLSLNDAYVSHYVYQGNESSLISVKALHMTCIKPLSKQLLNNHENTPPSIPKTEIKFSRKFLFSFGKIVFKSKFADFHISIASADGLLPGDLGTLLDAV